MRQAGAVSIPLSDARWLLLLLLAAAAACRDPTLRAAEPQAFRLVEKGPFQSLYGPDGRLDRLLYDRNGDRVADATLLYDTEGRVREAGIDTDLDHRVDRWEYFDGGTLRRLGFSRARNGVPDTWDVVAEGGSLTAREYDDDGDGRPDRFEPLR